MRLALCDPHATPRRVTVFECQDGKRELVAVYVVRDNKDWCAAHIEQARLLEAPALSTNEPDDAA